MAIAGSSISALRRVLLRLAAYISKDGEKVGIITGGVTFCLSHKTQGLRREGETPTRQPVGCWRYYWALDGYTCRLCR
jgi:hypothetical protein